MPPKVSHTSKSGEGLESSRRRSARPGLRHSLAAISALRSVARRALSVFYRSFALLLRSPAAMATPRHFPSEGSVERVGQRSSALGQKRIHGVRGSGRIGLVERHSPDRANPKAFEFRRAATPASTHEASTMRLTKVIAQYQRMAHYGITGFRTVAAFSKALDLGDDNKLIFCRVNEMFADFSALLEMASIEFVA